MSNMNDCCTLLVQSLQQLKYILARFQIQHCNCFVQNKDIGLDSKHTRYCKLLCLSKRKKIGKTFCLVQKLGHRKALNCAHLNFVIFKMKVLRTKSSISVNLTAYNLIFWGLKNKAYSFARLHFDASFLNIKKSADKTAQRTFTAAVCTYYCSIGARFNIKRNTIQGGIAILDRI